MGKVVPHKSRIEMDRFYGCCQKMCQTVFTQTRAGYFVFSSFSFGVIEKETWPTDAAAAALVAGKCVQQHMFFLVCFLSFFTFLTTGSTHFHYRYFMFLLLFGGVLSLGGSRGHKLKMPKLSYTHTHTRTHSHTNAATRTSHSKRGRHHATVHHPPTGTVRRRLAQWRWKTDRITSGKRARNTRATTHTYTRTREGEGPPGFMLQPCPPPPRIHGQGWKSTHY